jgi:hypothetical protein
MPPNTQRIAAAARELEGYLPRDSEQAAAAIAKLDTRRRKKGGRTSLKYGPKFADLSSNKANLLAVFGRPESPDLLEEMAEDLDLS